MDDNPAKIDKPETDEWLNLALKGARMGLWTWDATTNEGVWDERTYEIYGIPSRGGAGASMEQLMALVHPEDREPFAQKYAVATREHWPEIVTEYRVIWPDGSVRHVSTRGQTFYDQTGRLQRAVGVVQDITQQRKLEEQLRQAQKLESIGRLAGGIAHDFNNLLTVINGYSQILLREMDENNPLRAKAGQIHRAGEQAASLTRQLLAFGRKQVMDVQPLNINLVIREVEPILRRLIEENVELKVILEPSLGFTLADPNQMSQVILNLATNARDAMPQGGLLTLRTENVELTGRDPHANLDVPRGDYVLLTLSDTGAGMDAETQRHLFEPFFTTKGPGRGTGLGLATVYGIVTQTGGRIKCYSELGTGTVFRIYLPRTTTQNPSRSPASSDLEQLEGTETILVAEDQLQVRELTCHILRSSGYQVLEATSGKEALSILERHPEPIALLLTDVVMPGISGSELAEGARRIRPGISVLFMSGYTDQVISHHGMLDPGVELIQKPFDSDSLLAKVREMLTPGPAKGTVLIVDDEAGFRALIRDVLEDAGYQVLEAPDGKQAIAVRSDRSIDVLITDLAMPEMEGIEVIRAFSQSDQPPAIIAISGAFDESVLKAARLLGAKATLTKPIEIDQLVELVDSLVGK
jgi:two-component system, cell cycle sensor histidine kinase and response regulator CckA